MKAIAKKELCNADWKTQLARGYSDIPKGAAVEIVQMNFVNFYGEWVIVEYKDNRYYVKKEDLAIIEE